MAVTDFPLEAAEYKFVAEDSGPATRFCVAAGEDDLDGLKAAIHKIRRVPHQQYETIINSVRCNGQAAATFAHSYGASETFGYLYKFTTRQNREIDSRTSVAEFPQSRRFGMPVVMVLNDGNHVMFT